MNLLRNKYFVSYDSEIETTIDNLSETLAVASQSGSLVRVKPVVDGEEVALDEFLGGAGLILTPETASVTLSDFFFGVYGDEYAIAFPIRSYSSAYSGILNWETTIYNELEKIIPLGAFVNGAENVFSSFSSRVILNRDSRVLANFDGEIVLILDDYRAGLCRNFNWGGAFWGAVAERIVD